MKRRRVVLWLLSALILLALGLGLWMLHTDAGLRFTIARMQQALPGLSIAHASGTLSGSVQIDGLRYENNAVLLTVNRARVSIEILPLLFGHLRLRSLDLEAPLLRIKSRDNSEAPKNSALSLPELQVAALTARDVKVVQPDQSVQAWATLNAVVALHDTHIDILRLQLVHADFQLSGRADIDLLDPWWLHSGDLTVYGSADNSTPMQANLKRAASGKSAPFMLSVKRPLLAALTIQPGQHLEDFQALLSLPKQSAVDLGLVDDTQVQADLNIVSTSSQLSVNGTLGFNDYRAEIKAAEMQWLQSSLQIDSLPVAIKELGSFNLRGALPFSVNAPLSLEIVSESLRIARGADAAFEFAGKINLTGRYRDLSISPTLTIAQQGLPPGTLTGNVQVDAAAVRFNALALKLPRGRLIIDGSMLRGDNASATLALQLTAFDPSLFVSDWPGELSGNAQWSGTWAAQGANGTLSIAHIGGRLRAQPFDLRGSVAFVNGAARKAEIVATLGTAHAEVRGDIDGPEALSARIDVPDISVVLPATRGQLHARLNRSEQWQIEIESSALLWNTFSADSLTIMGSIGGGRIGANSNRILDLHANFRDISNGSVTLSDAEIDLSGTPDEHALHARLRNARGTIESQANGSWRAQSWDGVIERLDFTSTDRNLHLQQPVAVQASASHLSLSEACLTGSDQMQACLQGRYASGNGSAQFDIGALPLSWLSDALDERGYRLSDAILSGHGGAEWRDGALRNARLVLDSSEGRLLIPERADLVLGYSGLHLQADFDGESGSAVASTALFPEGRADAKFALFRDSEGAFGYDGDISVLIHQLDVIEALTTEIANPIGQINGQFRVQQDTSGFRVGGALALSAFSAEVPSLGLNLKNGSIALAGVPEGLILRGAVQSGDGTLTVDGRWAEASEQSLALIIAGNNVRLSNTPELSLIATPELKLERDQRGWNLSGTLDIPKARIQADLIEGGATQSADVIVIDDPPETTATSEKWRARVNVRMGEDVQLKGFGFDGKLRGQVAVRQSSGRSATATGQLVVTGLYNAYGQKLNVERGELLYAGSPLDEPSINVFAERKVGDSSAGIEITGTARNPISRVYARPALSESEALALLVTGRPLRDVRGNDRDRLSGAALALGTIGGDLLAKNLGLDELGVSSNAGIQGEAFTIGKYLSPRLFVGYGIGLLTRGEVFTVRYLINDRFEVEANVGERQRAAVNYRIER